MKKVSKLSSVFISIIFSSLAVVIFISILPKVIVNICLNFGVALDSNNLYTRYIVGTIVRTLGILTSLFIMKKTEVIKNIRFKWNKKYLLFSLLFIVYIIINISFVSISLDKIPLALLMILSCFGVGIFEEVVFRGLALGLLLKGWNVLL